MALPPAGSRAEVGCAGAAAQARYATACAGSACVLGMGAWHGGLAWGLGMCGPGMCGPGMCGLGMRRHAPVCAGSACDGCRLGSAIADTSLHARCHARKLVFAARRPAYE